MSNTHEKTSFSGVIWISGYSASGKTSVGRKLERKLRENSVNAIFLDGDDLRSIFGNRWGYKREDRIELAKVYLRLSSHLSRQGHVVILSAIAMYDEIREWFKQNIPNALEVYLDVPYEERLARDKATKGIYPLNVDNKPLYEEPKKPDLAVKNYGENTDEASAAMISRFFLENGAERLADRGKKDHWNAYYQKAVAPSTPSSFAAFVASKVPTPARCLEVGCGNGRDAPYLSDCGYAVTALDASEAAIDFCREQYADKAIDFTVGTVSKLLADEVNREAFDFIYSRFCLHAMTPEEEEEFFSAACKLLKPGGEVYIECRSINDPLARKGEVISPTERIHGHYRRFVVIDELLRRLADSGFEILESDEVSGVAKYKDDDPVVIRVVAKIKLI